MKKNDVILPLMPKATAVWLIDNTTLTFAQIAKFCGMHELEVKGIADGEVSSGIKGVDPVISGQLTRAEITRCENDSKLALQIKSTPVALSSAKSKAKKSAKYIPIARRQDKPDAIYWILKNLPSIENSKITKLLGTTKTTVESIREKTHWNMANIRPRDPVLLGLCTQIELDRLANTMKIQKTKDTADVADHADENQ